LTEQQAESQEQQTNNLPKGLQGGLTGLFHRLRETVLPEIHYLDDETREVIIRMAPYRRNFPIKVIVLTSIGFVISLVLAVLGWRMTWPTVFETAMIGLAIITGWALLRALDDILLYEQWQFIVTDKRIILVTPDPDRHGRADAIYLKGGGIRVLDTNWSKNPLWGLYQATTGARDVMLSMGGYEFREEGAKVKGGLRFPDVMPEDIKRLEELIFG
jgi:hypothetical protein